MFRYAGAAALYCFCLAISSTKSDTRYKCSKDLSDGSDSKFRAGIRLRQGYAVTGSPRRIVGRILNAVQNAMSSFARERRTHDGSHSDVVPRRSPTLKGGGTPAYITTGRTPPQGGVAVARPLLHAARLPNTPSLPCYSNTMEFPFAPCKKTQRLQAVSLTKINL